MTMYMPTAQTPLMTRRTNQGAGCTHRAWATATPEATEAMAAKARMWPTWRMRGGQRYVPPTNPKK